MNLFNATNKHTVLLCYNFNNNHNNKRLYFEKFNEMSTLGKQKARSLFAQLAYFFMYILKL